MQHPVRTTALLLFVLLAALPAAAQSDAKGPLGREFWLAFEKNFRDHIMDEEAPRPAHPLYLSLSITSETAASGYVEVPGLGYRRDFKVGAGGMVMIFVDSAAQVRSSEVVEKLGVHVVADNPISVTALSRRYQTTDSYVIYPNSSLGTSYRVAGFAWLMDDLLSQFAVVAVEDGTRVRITSSVDTKRGQKAGVPFEATLNRGDVYQVIQKFDRDSRSDLTGTLVDADKPVALFSGHNCSYVPDKSVKACNILIEQIPPLSSWGTRFAIGPLAGKFSSVYRVIASEDGTKVYQDDSLVAALNAGEYYTQNHQRRSTLVTASEPVLLVQYAKGYDAPPDHIVDETLPVVRIRRALIDSLELIEAPPAVMPTKSTPIESAPNDSAKAFASRPLTKEEMSQPSPDPPLVATVEKAPTEKPMNAKAKPRLPAPTITTDIHSASPPVVTRGRVALKQPKNSTEPVLTRSKPMESRLSVPMRDTASVRVMSPMKRAVKVPVTIDDGSGVGDPMMIVVAPAERYLSSYRFTTPSNGAWHHYVNIAIPTEAIGDLRIDGEAIDPTAFRKVGEGLSVAVVEIGFGPHVATCSAPFGLYNYGFGYDEFSYDAYGSSCGQSFGE